MACEYSISREHFQTLLEKLNRRWEPFAGTHPAPDGDTALAAADYEAFRIAACPSCEGVLKPSVVFFGESVPKRRVAAAMARLEQADALLVVGSSLMVFSGYRFVRRALERRVPVAAINVGRTRADDEISPQGRAALQRYPGAIAPLPGPRSAVRSVFPRIGICVTLGVCHTPFENKYGDVLARNQCALGGIGSIRAGLLSAHRRLVQRYRARAVPHAWLSHRRNDQGKSHHFRDG